MHRLAAIAFVIALVGSACSSAAPTGSPSGSGPGPSGAGPLPTGSAPPVDTRPSRAALIQEAVAEGRLDQVTGLIYRAYAALGMPGLPAEYSTAPPVGDDRVLASMTLLMPELSAADQARLTPFVVRPTDPQSIFRAQPAASVSGMPTAADSHPTARCSKWAHSGDLDQRFKVWACADASQPDAEIDIATVVVLLTSIWDKMIAAAPAGMGPPKADTTAADPNNAHGGDGRIDFYLLDLGRVIHRDFEDNEVASDAVAQSNATEPFSNSTSSGFVLLNRERLGDEKQMRLDVIHEFFHVLQFAHNTDAPGTDPGHWFVEASATWSEAYFAPQFSEETHKWHGYFQNSDTGLESPDEQHQYSAYIWPFFMQQEKQAASVFNAWQQIGAIGDGTFEQVTDAISAQLPFDKNFHEFAVRNVNIENTLAQAGVKTYEQTDGHFWENYPPSHMKSADIVPGQPYVGPASSTEPLAADYYSFEVTPAAREVTVSMVNVTPGGQADGDALVHIEGGGWAKRPLTGRMLKFCRDNPPDNIDHVILVVSNHGRQGSLGGSVEASAKDKCSNDRHLGGTLQWSRESLEIVHRQPDLPDWVRTITVTGTAQIMLLVTDTGYHYELSAERGGGSTYSYDYEYKAVGNPDPDPSNCVTHEEGVLETSGGVPDGFFGDWNIGRLNPIGGLFEDILLSFDIRDWCGPQMGMDVPEELRGASFNGFITCPENEFSLTAEFDGSGAYRVDCSYEYDRSSPGFTDTGSGHVEVTLTMLDGPHPTPR